VISNEDKMGLRRPPYAFTEQGVSMLSAVLPLESKEAVPKCGVFFDVQIFDAYILANKIIKSAKQSIVLIDNYID
jgi:hypothetical protein